MTARHEHPYDVERRRHIHVILKSQGPAAVDRHLAECTSCWVCVSQRFWRLVCRRCVWRGEWTDGKVLGASSEAVDLWAKHVDNTRTLVRQ